MSNTPALDAEYRKVIPARFVTRRDGQPLKCSACATDLVMGQAFAATTGDGWHSYCATCSASIPAQVGGLVQRIEALVAPLGENIPPTVVAMVEAATPLIERALSGDITAFLQVKPVLNSIRGQINVARRDERDATAIDLSSLVSGMYAVPHGDTRLKLQIDNVDKGKWAGFVFVKDGAVYGEGKRYGMQKPGRTYQGDVQDALRAILADPKAAMAAYGHLTSTCGMCRRPLEDEQSVARGIGPICWAKFS